MLSTNIIKVFFLLIKKKNNFFIILEKLIKEKLQDLKDYYNKMKIKDSLSLNKKN